MNREDEKMELVIRHFDELTKEELYEIMRLRVQVFVVEQTCPYQEIDGRDVGAYHLYLKDENGIQAYLRVMDQGVMFEDVAIGRVFSRIRRKGYATQLMKAGIRVAREKFSADRITLEAQTYARSLYEKVGFVQTSEEFLEEGIPHIKMTLTLNP